MKKVIRTILFLHFAFWFLLTSAKDGGHFVVKPFTPTFIENKGQYDQFNTDKSKVLFGAQLGNTIVLFKSTSVSFIVNVAINKEAYEDGGEQEHEREFVSHRQTIRFLNASKNPEAVAAEDVPQYFTFP